MGSDSLHQAVQSELSGAPARFRAGVALCVKGLLCVCLALTVTEACWRYLGYRPEGSDLILFAKLRKSLAHDPQAVALAGSSRVRCGLNPAIFAATVPDRRFVQLGILGNNALPVLEDLALDQSFQGSVICELHAHDWLGEAAAVQPPPLAYMHPALNGNYVESWLGEHLRERFTFISYNLVTEMPRILQRRRIPEPEQPDRFLPAYDYGPELNAAGMQRWLQVLRDSTKSLKNAGPGPGARAVPAWVAQIRRRGGNVVFVRMPIDGQLRTEEEAALPQIAMLIGTLRSAGIEVVDFAEMPTHYWCTDGSHLEVREAARFSRALAEILIARGFFAAPH
jgi:hypothetical protein